MVPTDHDRPNGRAEPRAITLLDFPFPSASVADWQSAFLVELYLVGRSDCAALPTGLLFGIPAVVAISSLLQRQRRWVWTEWVALATAGLLAALYLIAAVSSLLDETPAERGADILGAALWLTVVIVLSLAAIRISRWIEKRLQ